MLSLCYTTLNIKGKQQETKRHKIKILLKFQYEKRFSPPKPQIWPKVSPFDRYLKNGFFVSLEIYTKSAPVGLDTFPNSLDFCFYSNPIRHAATIEIFKPRRPPKYHIMGPVSPNINFNHT